MQHTPFPYLGRLKKKILIIFYDYYCRECLTELLISGSSSAICAGGWLPRRLPGKRLRDLFPNNSGGKLCNKLLRSRSRFYENPEPNYYFYITVIVIISLLFLFSVLNYFKRTGTIILSHTVFKFLKGPVRYFIAFGF